MKMYKNMLDIGRITFKGSPYGKENFGYRMRDLRNFIKNEAIDDDFYRHISMTISFVKMICISENLVFALSVEKGDGVLMDTACSAINIYLSDYGFRFLYKRYINANNLFSEIERVIEESIRFFENTGNPVEYIPHIKK